MKWQDVYKLPLNLDEWSDNYAWCKDGTMALTFDGLSVNERERCVKTINGEDNFKISGLSFDGCDFYQNGDYIFCVRGWGNLTGIGALNLPEEKALEIQDGFVQYIFDKLKEQ